MHVEIQYLRHNMGRMITDQASLDIIREHFSVKNPNAAMIKRANRFASTKTYAITPTGQFYEGMLLEIVKYLKDNNYTFKIDTDLLVKTMPQYTSDESCLYQLNKPYRWYQEESISKSMVWGRGVIVLPTATGKTLTLAGIIYNIRKYTNNPKLKVLITTPLIQLVEQTRDDLIEYGFDAADIAVWRGGIDADPNASIIVCSNKILLSKNTDKTLLAQFDLCVFDECHGLKRGNELLKVFKYIKTPHRFGLTGTLPDRVEDIWSIKGFLGEIIYQKKVDELKEYLASFKVFGLHLEHLDVPKIEYRQEIEYLAENQSRNDFICKLAHKLQKNTLILVDRIVHGESVYKQYTEKYPDKPCFFIRGSTPLEDRQHVSKLMDDNNDIVIIAISRIFSTGINIPNLQALIFAQIGKAKIKVLQSISRTLRQFNNKCAEIFDISDNLKYSLRHLEDRKLIYEKEKYPYIETRCDI